MLFESFCGLKPRPRANCKISAKFIIFSSRDHPMLLSGACDVLISPAIFNESIALIYFLGTAKLAFLSY